MTNCVTTTHWATHYAPECSPGGSGNCEGSCERHGNECSCPCHRDANLPGTIEGVRQWHDERNDVVASFPGDGVDVEDIAIEAAKGMARVHPDMIFAPQKGQDRYFITRSHR